MTPDDLKTLGIELVDHCREQGVLARLYGGVAVYARCESISTHPHLQRAPGDLDVIAAGTARDILLEHLILRRFRVTSKTAGKALLKRDEVTVDIRGTDFRDQAYLDLAPRLELERTTLPLADLLLLNLQRFPFEEKDVKDSIALLLDHRVASGGDEDTIDRDYLYRLTNRNWGLWTIVFDNTVTLEKILNRYIEPEEAQLVWRRIELIQEVMDGKGKSLSWWLRSIPNRKLKWYREATPG